MSNASSETYSASFRSSKNEGILEYWDKIRYLARTLLMPPCSSAEDAYALFGNVNLDTHRSGSASRVEIDPVFARWVLETIRDKLRPSVLVCLGVKGKLKHRSLREAFETTFGLKLSEPDEKYAFDRYFFDEWDASVGADRQLKVIFWPNHPSRHPFSSFEKWQAACQEFKNRNGKLVDRIWAGQRKTNHSNATHSKSGS